MGFPVFDVATYIFKKVGFLWIDFRVSICLLSSHITNSTQGLNLVTAWVEKIVAMFWKCWTFLLTSLLWVNQTLRMIQVFPRSFREDNDHDEHPGRASTSTVNTNVEKIKKIIEGNSWITVRTIADDVGILISSCHAIFPDVLGMKRESAELIMELLNFEQKCAE